MMNRLSTVAYPPEHLTFQNYPVSQMACEGEDQDEWDAYGPWL